MNAPRPDPAARRAAATLDDPRWARVAARDAAADGSFFYSVRTTGVYCRPSCPSRAARPEHVAFHASAADAERAGFRPCLRCRPDRPDAAPAPMNARLVADLCRFIDAAESPPTLDALARRAGLSRWHLHRTFRQVTGVTPRAYAAARRAERLRQALDGGGRASDADDAGSASSAATTGAVPVASAGRPDADLGDGAPLRRIPGRPAAPITAAALDAGFASSGRFYETTPGVLGMTPSAYRAGGAGATLRFAVGPCALGEVLVAASDKGVCAILLGDDADDLLRELQRRFPRAELVGGDAGFERTVAAVVALVGTPRLGLDLPLDVRGTAFQQRVWQALREIPHGTTVSYADIARRIGAPSAVRAVAQACGANPLAVIVPCHRVVRHDGGLSGYRWGIERKRALLAREAQTPSPSPAAVGGSVAGATPQAVP